VAFTASSLPLLFFVLRYGVPWLYEWWTAEKLTLELVVQGLKVRSMKARILLSFVQVCTRLQSSLNLCLPPAVEQFFSWGLAWFEVFDVLMFVSNWECLWRNDLVTRIWIMSCVSLILAIGLYIAYRVFDRQHYMDLMLAFLYIIYPSMTATLFSFFDCRKFEDGVEYLLTDPTLRCTEPRYNTAKIPVWSAIVIFVVGTVVTLGYLLYCHRSNINPNPPAFKETGKRERMNSDEKLQWKLDALYKMRIQHAQPEPTFLCVQTFVQQGSDVKDQHWRCTEYLAAFCDTKKTPVKPNTGVSPQASRPEHQVRTHGRVVSVKRVFKHTNRRTNGRGIWQAVQHPASRLFWSGGYWYVTSVAQMKEICREPAGTENGGVDRSSDGGRWDLSSDPGSGLIQFGSRKEDIPFELRDVLRQISTAVMEAVFQAGGLTAIHLQTVHSSLGDNGIMRVLSSADDGWCFWHSVKHNDMTPGELITLFSCAINSEMAGNQRDEILRTIGKRNPIISAAWCEEQVHLLADVHDLATGEHRIGGVWADSALVVPILAVLLKRRFVVFSVSMWSVMGSDAVVVHEGATWETSCTTSLLACECNAAGVQSQCTCSWRREAGNQPEYIAHATEMLIRTHTPETIYIIHGWTTSTQRIHNGQVRTDHMDTHFNRIDFSLPLVPDRNPPTIRKVWSDALSPLKIVGDWVNCSSGVLGGVAETIQIRASSKPEAEEDTALEPLFPMMHGDAAVRLSPGHDKERFALALDFLYAGYLPEC
jgi:hypothetical protein